MESSIEKNLVSKKRRTMRVRKQVRGCADKPRLCVVKTNKHIQAQLINDEAGVTLAAVSTNSKELRQTPYCKKNKQSAKMLGEKMAEKAKSLGIQTVVFDRGPFAYHGILAEFAESARSKGLAF
jgi:large subunit ribosomal protein L18